MYVFISVQSSENQNCCIFVSLELGLRATEGTGPPSCPPCCIARFLLQPRTDKPNRGSPLIATKSFNCSGTKLGIHFHFCNGDLEMEQLFCKTQLCCSANLSFRSENVFRYFFWRAISKHISIIWRSCCSLDNLSFNWRSHIALCTHTHRNAQWGSST